MVAAALDTATAAVVSTDGTKIWAGQAGRAASDAPTIVFIPGYASSALFFDRQFSDASLLSRFCLIAYEPRGQGRSGLPAGADASAFSSARQAQDFAAVLRYYGAERVFIAGWSAGGIVPADVFAHLAPDCVAGLVLLAATPYRAVFPAVVWPAASRVLEPLVRPADGDELAASIEVFVDLCVYAPNGAAMPYALRAALVGAVAGQLPRTRARQDGGHVQDPTALLAAAPALPVLFVMGDEDAISSPDRLEAQVCGAFPRTQVLRLPACGHAPFWEKAAEVNAAMAAFVESVAVRNTG